VKLVRLLLEAFGPFTDTVIDFAGDDQHPLANLHLIYGPNEAGKSSALRAMTDLRFGIPLRSPDDFLHLSKRLRIAGAFVDGAGEVLGLARRKGRGATLSRCDPKTGEPLAPPEVTRDQELALTGGLQRDEFEAMFGLNHARLRAGGDLLLKGEGELGAALFEASAGTRGIAAILADLEADAKSLYNPHGRAQSATINEARRQLDEQRQLWKQAQTRPADWEEPRDLLVLEYSDEEPVPAMEIPETLRRVEPLDTADATVERTFVLTQDGNVLIYAADGALEDSVREKIVEAVRTCGFRYAALDLEGYRPGSLNRALAGPGPARGTPRRRGCPWRRARR